MRVTIDVRIIIMFLGGSRHDSHHCHSQMQLKQGGVMAFLKHFEHQPGPPSVTSRGSMWVYIRSICERFVKIHGPLILLLFYIIYFLITYIYIYNIYTHILFYFISFCIIWYDMILYYIILCCILLYYIIWYPIHRPHHANLHSQDMFEHVHFFLDSCHFYPSHTIEFQITFHNIHHIQYRYIVLSIAGIDLFHVSTARSDPSVDHSEEVLKSRGQCCRCIRCREAMLRCSFCDSKLLPPVL